jgi:hypothetical protein
MNGVTTQSGQQTDEGITNLGESDFTSLTQTQTQTLPQQSQQSQQQTPPEQTQQTGQPGQSEQGQTPPTIPPAAPALATPAAPVFDSRMLESVVEAAARGARGAQQAQQPTEKDLSPEEFNRKFGVVQVNESHIAALMDADPKKAAAVLNNLLQGSVAQAVRMANELHQAEFGRMREEITPHIQSWQQYQRERLDIQAKDRFFETNKDLLGEEDLVMTIKDAILTKVQSGQIRFTSEQEAFNAVATASRQLLTRMNKKTAAVGGTQNTQTTGQNTGRQMSTASAAGRSGTGQATALSDVEQIFGKDAV